MREIRFRAKRLDNGEWIYGDLIRPHVHNGAEWMIYPPDKPLYAGKPVDGETVGQFIGIQDAKGNDIYEGDIVEGVAFGGDKVYGKVYWENGAFYIGGNISRGMFCNNYRSDFRGTICNIYRGDEFTVIGNIHDQPKQMEV